jgi:tyrosyl-tRNA synthetase
MDLLADLEARGLLHDTTDRDAFEARLAEGPITIYAGFDPTADSLHAGNMVGLLMLRRFQDAGHRVISLAGGATGMIGDPSGRTAERGLLDDETLARNLEGIRPQLRQFLDFDSKQNPAKLLDNRAWTVGVGVLEFLRDVGKHVTVNHMMAKESVRARMAGEEGISFTEFAYMLLQAHDFLWLYENERCELQGGGSDQWGNITLGVDLIRRRTGGRAHGLVWPLLTQADGTKYGKTASGDTMWLSAERMSPYRFYQGWMQVPDDDIARLLLQLTLLPVEECHAIAAAHAAAPEARQGQRRVAFEVTSLAHGEEAAGAATEASELVFGGDPRGVSAAALSSLVREIPSTALPSFDLELIDVLCRTDLVSSRSDARRALAEGSIYLDGERVVDEALELAARPPLAGGHHLLRRGKRRYHLLHTKSGTGG